MGAILTFVAGISILSRVGVIVVLELSSEPFGISVSASQIIKIFGSNFPNSLLVCLERNQL